MKKIILTFLILSQASFAKPTCEANLEAHLNSISNDRVTQEKFIAFPLKHTYIDIKSSDMPKVQVNLSREDIKTREFPIYPLKSRQRSDGLIQKIVNSNENDAIVSMFKPDTDYAMEYKFKRSQRCWILMEYNDYSL